MEKIPVYMMPGLAASPLIFERIRLDETQFDVHWLSWKVPLRNESLQDYALRMSLEIKHENPVLMGVSFGGVLVQEMAAFVRVRKVIIVSSVKTQHEIPLRMKVIRNTKAYLLVPTRLLQNIEVLRPLAFNYALKLRFKLYEKYLSMRDKNYLEWAIFQMLYWSRTVADQNVIHIHGDADEVFPIQNIQNCITVPGGSHIMIVLRYRWFNEYLPKIILNN
jgi:pimeloyl-ACP methyl ester carboxylesterase